MIETIVSEYLLQRVKEKVYMEVPEKPPERYVIIEKTGGSKENHICYSTLAIQSAAESLYQAAVLNEAVKQAMCDIADESEVCKCSLNSDYNFTDTATKNIGIRQFLTWYIFKEDRHVRHNKSINQ